MEVVVIHRELLMLLELLMDSATTLRILPANGRGEAASLAIDLVARSNSLWANTTWT